MTPLNNNVLLSCAVVSKSNKWETNAKIYVAVGSRSNFSHTKNSDRYTFTLVILFIVYR